jgi:hypothetical protein
MSEKFGKPISDLTMVDISKMPGDIFKELLKHPGGASKVDELIAKRQAEVAVREQAAGIAAPVEEVPSAEPQSAIDALLEPQPEVPAGPTPEETAAAEAAAQAEAAAVQIREQAAAAEAEAVRVEAARVTEANKPKRFVIDFQAKDDHGSPIGKKTHL